MTGHALHQGVSASESGRCRECVGVEIGCRTSPVFTASHKRSGRVVGLQLAGGDARLRKKMRERFGDHRSTPRRPWRSARARATAAAEVAASDDDLVGRLELAGGTKSVGYDRRERPMGA